MQFNCKLSFNQRVRLLCYFNQLNYTCSEAKKGTVSIMKIKGTAINMLKSYIELVIITLIIHFISNLSFKGFFPIPLWLIPVTIFMVGTGFDKKIEKISPKKVFK